MLSVRPPTVIVALDPKLSDARTGVGDMLPTLLPQICWAVSLQISGYTFAAQVRER